MDACSTLEYQSRKAILSNCLFPRTPSSSSSLLQCQLKRQLHHPVPPFLWIFQSKPTPGHKLAFRPPTLGLPVSYLHLSLLLQPTRDSEDQYFLLSPIKPSMKAGNTFSKNLLKFKALKAFIELYKVV